jgi:hypothetical protein
LKIPFVITAIQGTWHYVIDRIGFTTACLACVSVTFQDSFAYLSPLACAAITFEDTAH